MTNKCIPIGIMLFINKNNHSQTCFDSSLTMIRARFINSYSPEFYTDYDLLLKPQSLFPQYRLKQFHL